MPCGASSIARFFVSAWRPACAVDRPHRADVDDRAARAAVGHRPGDGLRDPERGVEDRAERLVHVLLGLLEERDGAEDARAVDEHVDGAEAVDRRGHERLRQVAPGDRARVDRGALAGRVDLALRGLEDLGAGPGEDHPGALVEEPLRRRPADAATAAGDEDDLAFVLGAHRCSFGLSIRCTDISCVCINITCTCSYCKCR
jgi:hypothetical protein